MKEDELWSKGSFVEPVSKEEMEEKEKTIHESHDDNMDFNCKECDKKISPHNRDWHDGMCDGCFNEKHFPEG